MSRRGLITVGEEGGREREKRGMRGKRDKRDKKVKSRQARKGSFGMVEVRYSGILVSCIQAGTIATDTTQSKGNTTLHNTTTTDTGPSGVGWRDSSFLFSPSALKEGIWVDDGYSMDRVEVLDVPTPPPSNNAHARQMATLSRLRCWDALGYWAGDANRCQSVPIYANGLGAFIYPSHTIRAAKSCSKQSTPEGLNEVERSVIFCLYFLHSLRGVRDPLLHAYTYIEDEKPFFASLAPCPPSISIIIPGLLHVRSLVCCPREDHRKPVSEFIDSALVERTIRYIRHQLLTQSRALPRSRVLAVLLLSPTISSCLLTIMGSALRAKGCGRQRCLDAEPSGCFWQRQWQWQVAIRP